MATNQSNIDILIKRRLNTGEATAAAPADNALKNGELAMNEVDQTLYYGLSTANGTISAVPIAGDGFIKDFLSSSSGAGNLTLGQPITSDITVGSIDEGEALAANTTLYAFVTSLLYKEYDPKINAHSASLTKSSPVGDVEYGSVQDVDLAAAFNPGTIGGVMDDGKWDLTVSQGSRAGAASKYEFQVGSETYEDNGTDPTYTFTNQSFIAAKTYNARVTFGAGSQPKTSKNNNATKDNNGNAISLLASSTITTSTVTITPKAAVFTKTSATDIGAATSANLKALTKTLAKAIDSTADYSLNLSFSVGHKYAVIAYPNSWGDLVSVKLSNGQTITDAFDKQTNVELDLDSGGTATYRVYKWTGDTAMSNVNTWSVTLP